MNQWLLTLPSLVFAVVVLVLLAKSDERRKQLSKKLNQVNYGINLTASVRRMLVWSLLIPAIVFLSMSNFAGLLMYAGALTVIGWLVTELPVSIV